MAEPSGHTLLTETLRVINRAIDAHRDASPWREVVAGTSGRRDPTVYAVALSEGDPGRIVDHYSVRAHEGRLEVVDHGPPRGPADWNVAVETLRDIVAHPDRYVDDPGRLPLGWLASRLGIGAPPKPAQGWRIGRVRRPR